MHNFQSRSISQKITSTFSAVSFFQDTQTVSKEKLHLTLSYEKTAHKFWWNWYRGYPGYVQASSSNSVIPKVCSADYLWSSRFV